MKHTLKLIMVALTLTSSAYAEEDKDCDEICRIKDHLKYHFFIFSPRYFSQGHMNADAAFTNNGFAAPSSGLASFYFTFGRHFESNFDLGIEFGQGAQSREVGANEATYSFMHGGLYAAYDFLGESNTDLKLGSTLGYGGTELEVLSGTSGRVTEGAMYWGPSISIAQKVSNGFRLGIVGSYHLPFGSNRDSKGTDLGSQKISPRGASVGLQLIFGRFGAEPEEKK